MSNGTNYDIAIIGAGIAGLSAAYFLSPHARVIVLEQEEQPAYHSSGRSAAMYIEGYENPVVSELTKLGAEFFFTPPQGFTEHRLVNPCGGLTAAGPGETKALEQYLATWRSRCPELSHIGPKEARDIVPILREDWLSGAAWDPSWHNIDVHELLSGYIRGLRANGGVLKTKTTVTGLAQQADTWVINVGGEPLSADVVVNAAGAWANHIATLAGARTLPLTPMRRTAAIAPAPENSEAWPLVHTISADLYFKPESPGLMICPQDETPSEAMDALPDDLDVAIGIDRFHRITDHGVERVLRSWAGLRTFSADRFPTVGFVEDVSGYFWLAGQGGFGVQTSPGLGRHAADIILGREPVRAQIDAQRFLN